MYGLAAVMYQAAQVEDNTAHQVSEKMARLEYENKHLREVLQLSFPVVSHEDDSINLHSCSVNSDNSPQNSKNSQWSKIDRF